MSKMRPYHNNEVIYINVPSCDLVICYVIIFFNWNQTYLSTFAITLSLFNWKHLHKFSLATLMVIVYFARDDNFNDINSL